MSAIPDEHGAAVAGIALDLEPLTGPYGAHRRLSVRIERLLPHARLSNGRNNGDRSWSLSLEDLDGLCYFPPEGLCEPHSLSVKIIAIDEDAAATLEQVELPIPVDASPPPTVSTASPEPHVDATVQDSVPQRPPADQARSLQEAAVRAFQPAEAEPAPSFDEALAARLSEARTAWAAEESERIAAAVAEAENRSRDEIDSLRKQAAEAEAGFRRELERRLAETRASWEAEEKDHVAAAVAAAENRNREEVEALRRQVADAEARFAAELVRQLDEADAIFHSEMAQAMAAAVAEAGATAEADTAARIETAVREGRMDLERELAAAQARCGEAEAALDEVRRRAETVPDADPAHIEAAVADALRERDAAWERTRNELERVAEEKTRTAVESALKAARDGWEAELQERLSAASARCAEAEAALAAARRDAETPPEPDPARIEATVAAAMQAREQEWARAYRELERQAEETKRKAIDSELKAARNSWNVELQDRLSAAADEAEQRLAEKRDIWLAERAKLLREAEENALARFRAAGEGERLQRGAAGDVAADAGPAAASNGQWATFRRKARGRGAIVRSRIVRLMRVLIRIGVIAACAIGALLAYPHVRPLVVDSWWPKVVSYGNRTEPVLRDIGDAVKSRLQGLTAVPESRARVKVPSANVRADPSTAASVVDLLYYNAGVTLLARQGEWLRVRLDGAEGKAGWIHQSLLEDVPPSQ